MGKQANKQRRKPVKFVCFCLNKALNSVTPSLRRRQVVMTAGLITAVDYCNYERRRYRFIATYMDYKNLINAKIKLRCDVNARDQISTVF